MMAINAPPESWMPPLLEPDAPARVPSAADPGLAPTEPALASSPWWLAVSVARGKLPVVCVAIISSCVPVS